MGRPLPRVRRPCDECPWRRDAQPGRFTRERWEKLVSTTARHGGSRDGYQPGIGDPMFACHKTPDELERACAGWLAVEGRDHVTVRLACAMGELPYDALDPSPDWPPLFESIAAAAAHDRGEEVPPRG